MLSETEKQELVEKVGNIFGLQDKGYYVDRKLFPLTGSCNKEGSYADVAALWVSSILTTDSSTTGFSLDHTVGRNMLGSFSNIYILGDLSRYDKVVQEQYIDNIIELIKQKKPVIIEMGYNALPPYEGHAWYIGICQEQKTQKIKLFSSNRGQGHKESALWMTDFNELLLVPKNRKKLKNILIRLLTASSDNKYYSTVEDAAKERYALLEKMALPSAKIDAFGHKFSLQKTGNCTVANLKPILYALLSLTYPELTDEEVLKIYKEWTTFLRLSNIDYLLNAVKEGSTDLEKTQVVKEMLLAIMIKLFIKFNQKWLETPERSIYLLAYLMEELDSIGLYSELYNKLPMELRGRLNYREFLDFVKKTYFAKKLLEAIKKQDFGEIANFKEDGTFNEYMKLLLDDAVYNKNFDRISMLLTYDQNLYLKDLLYAAANDNNKEVGRTLIQYDNILDAVLCRAALEKRTGIIWWLYVLNGEKVAHKMQEIINREPPNNLLHIQLSHFVQNYLNPDPTVEQKGVRVRVPIAPTTLRVPSLLKVPRVPRVLKDPRAPSLPREPRAPRAPRESSLPIEPIMPRVPQNPADNADGFKRKIR